MVAEKSARPGTGAAGLPAGRSVPFSHAATFTRCCRPVTAACRAAVARAAVTSATATGAFTMYPMASMAAAWSAVSSGGWV